MQQAKPLPLFRQSTALCFRVKYEPGVNAWNLSRPVASRVSLGVIAATFLRQLATWTSSAGVRKCGAQRWIIIASEWGKGVVAEQAAAHDPE